MINIQPMDSHGKYQLDIHPVHVLNIFPCTLALSITCVHPQAHSPRHKELTNTQKEKENISMSKIRESLFGVGFGLGMVIVE